MDRAPKSQRPPAAALKVSTDERVLDLWAFVLFYFGVLTIAVHVVGFSALFLFYSVVFGLFLL